MGRRRRRRARSAPLAGGYALPAAGVVARPDPFGFAPGSRRSSPSPSPGSWRATSERLGDKLVAVRMAVPPEFLAKLVRGQDAGADEVHPDLGPRRVVALYERGEIEFEAKARRIAGHDAGELCALDREAPGRQRIRREPRPRGFACCWRRSSRSPRSRRAEAGRQKDERHSSPRWKRTAFEDLAVLRADGQRLRLHAFFEDDRLARVLRADMRLSERVARSRRRLPSRDWPG